MIYYGFLSAERYQINGSPEEGLSFPEKIGNPKMDSIVGPLKAQILSFKANAQILPATS
jgi:hypothetical protein